jgi:kinesin family protein 6/9
MRDSELLEDDAERPAVTSDRIDIYCRFRPSRNPARSLCEIDNTTGKVEIKIPHVDTSGFVNNSREQYSFKFSHIFDTDASQGQVFDTLAKPIVDSVLQGYNGTIFAYGQTGSGKTFSITGGTAQYEQRGIIPRALSHIFAELERRTQLQSTVRVSYLEIYNLAGYDLLDPSHESKALEDLPKVGVVHDENGGVALRNLGEFTCGNVDEALNLLFVGDTNRIVCETPSNDVSTRSHCVFTISLEMKDVGGGSGKVRRSKLHLVDLAGSERVKKTDIKGKIFTEAKYINLSLHYLEQVIVALQERSRGKRSHVPYRNSLLTMMLQDSLGGNCRTAMLATMSMEQGHLDETVSTARFAQRVALIRNETFVNEEVDPRLLVGKLKAQLRETREQLLSLQGKAPPPGPLSADDRERCLRALREFLAETPAGVAAVAAADTVAAAVGAEAEHLRWGGGLRPLFVNATKVGFFLEQLKAMYLKAAAGAGGSAGGAGAAAPGLGELASTRGLGSGVGTGASEGLSSAESAAYQEEVRRLRLLVHARDNEIAILAGMLQQRDGAPPARAAQLATDAKLQAVLEGRPLPPAAVLQRLEAGAAELRARVPGAGGGAGGGDTASGLSREEQQELVDRASAFEAYKATYGERDAIESNKAALKASIEEAKAVGEGVNAARAAVGAAKERLDFARQERVAQSVRAAADGVPAPEGEAASAEEAALLDEMETQKRAYRDGFLRLKDLRTRIESLQHMMEKQRRKLQSDFDGWFTAEQSKVVRRPGTHTPAAGPAPTAAAAASPVPAYKPPTPTVSSGSSGNPAYGAYSSGPATATPTAAAPAYGGTPTYGTAPAYAAAPAATEALSARRHPSSGPAGAAPAGGGSGGGGLAAMAQFMSTGNKQADADIAAFYKIRDEMLKRP